MPAQVGIRERKARESDAAGQALTGPPSAPRLSIPALAAITAKGRA